MTDIVERLHQGAGHIPVDIIEAEKVMVEAADELERLRAALQEIAGLPRVDGNDPFEVNRRGQELRLNEQARDIARRALEQKP